MKFPRLEDIDTAGKTVLLRTDLNVPMQGGNVTDATRITRLLPTLDYLIRQNARIVLLSHFGRPGGQFVPSLSLAPLVDAVSAAMGGRDIRFGVDCAGAAAKEAVAQMKPGDVLLLENLRFHPEEEAGDTNFARELASLGDVFVNDAFSASHRAHASITGIAAYLPVAAGRLMEEELAAIYSLFSDAKKPVAAIVGGSKISTKLALLESLIHKVDHLIIGGAMANTFLLAQGHGIGASLAEPDLQPTAQRILAAAKQKGCDILLPLDVMAGQPSGGAVAGAGIDAIPADSMALDIGNATLRAIFDCLAQAKTVIWNGPTGLFETRPFDVSTIMIARELARLTAEGRIKSVAGGGDTVAALNIAGLAGSLTYVSTAGGAFLEYLEGKTLPGIEALIAAGEKHKAKAHA